MRHESRIDPELLKKAHEAALAAGEEPVKRQGPSLSQVAPKDIPKEHTGEDLDDDDDGDDAEEARQALKRPEGRTLKKSSSRSRVVPARRRGRRRGDDDDNVAPSKAKAEDDDEVEVVVGGSLLLMGFGWWFGGISLVSLTLCVCGAPSSRGGAVPRSAAPRAQRRRRTCRSDIVGCIEWRWRVLRWRRVHQNGFSSSFQPGARPRVESICAFA